MHLSKEIQSRLDKLNSKIKLDLTVDGIFPKNYCFYDDDIREFTIMFASSNKEFSLVLCEMTEGNKGRNCLARGLFNDLDRLASVINLWVDKKDDISLIGKMFDELELFAGFKYKNSNEEIERAWTEVKNRIFNDTHFWKDKEWKSRYIEMLNIAKNHPLFKDYFPTMSHYWLVFSIGKDFGTWPLEYYISPEMKRGNDLSGGFYVSWNNAGKLDLFDTAKEALDFFAEKLKAFLPTKYSAK